MNTILGKKIGMTQVFVSDLRIPVTRIMAGPCYVTQIKKSDVDGYWAIQLGFDTRRSKNTSKPLQGHLNKSQSASWRTNLKSQNLFLRYLKEVRLKKEPSVQVGDEVFASSIFNKGDVVSVTGVSKGKGFAGGVKRWGFAGGPKTHGQSDRTRAPGSIGAGTTPGRVYKGKHMAGRMGTEQTTIANLHVIEVDKESNEILVSGAVPGRIGAYISIVKTSSGSLADLEKEVVAQVVEGEAEVTQEKEKINES